MGIEFWAVVQGALRMSGLLLPKNRCGLDWPWMVRVLSDCRAAVLQIMGGILVRLGYSVKSVKLGNTRCHAINSLFAL